MKSLEIIFRLLDQFLTAIKLRKAQNERDKLEKNPAGFFNDHFGNSLQPKDNKANKANSSNKG